MSLLNVQGPLLHSGDHIVLRILTVDYTFNRGMHPRKQCEKNRTEKNRGWIDIRLYFTLKMSLSPDIEHQIPATRL